MDKFRLVLHRSGPFAFVWFLMNTSLVLHRAEWPQRHGQQGQTIHSYHLYSRLLEVDSCVSCLMGGVSRETHKVPGGGFKYPWQVSVNRWCLGGDAPGWIPDPHRPSDALSREAMSSGMVPSSPSSAAVMACSSLSFF